MRLAYVNPLDVGHATGRDAPSPGVRGAQPPRAPLAASPNGGVPDAEQTIASRCQCPPHVAGAGRRTYCDRCNAPVVHVLDGVSAAAGANAEHTVSSAAKGGNAPDPAQRLDAFCCVRHSGSAPCATAATKAPSLNENDRDGCTRPGQAQEVVAPMRDASYPDALAALDAEVRRGGRSVEVACPDDDCAFGLLLIDDSRLRLDGHGNREHVERVYVIQPGSHERDPELGALDRCPGCLDEIRPDLVVLRDRKHRATAEIAELRAA